MGALGRNCPYQSSIPVFTVDASWPVRQSGESRAVPFDHQLLAPAGTIFVPSDDAGDPDATPASPRTALVIGRKSILDLFLRKLT